MMELIVTFCNFANVPSKGEVCPITSHENPEREKRYSFALSLTSALEGVGG
jgi:hypothetical protein